jgi:hypothetical protein
MGRIFGNWNVWSLYRLRISAKNRSKFEGVGVPEIIWDKSGTKAHKKTEGKITLGRPRCRWGILRWIFKNSI